MPHLHRRTWGTLHRRPRQPGSTGTGARGGFTLLELLTVISIIALLALIAFPAISLVRDMARTIGCANHVRQIELTAQLYAADNEGLETASINFSGSEPLVGVSAYPGNTRLRQWPDYLLDTGALDGFTEGSSRGVWSCPANQEPVDRYTNLHYAANAGVHTTYDPNNPNFAAVPTSRIPSRSNKVGFADATVNGWALWSNNSGNSFLENTGGFPDPAWYWDRTNGDLAVDAALSARPGYQTAWGSVYDDQGSNPTSSTILKYRHRGRINVSWKDGHVSQVGHDALRLGNLTIRYAY